VFFGILGVVLREAIEEGGHYVCTLCNLGDYLCQLNRFCEA
jgi:hypothetical protein